MTVDMIKPREKPSAEDLFADLCASYRLPTPIRQFTFAKEAMGRMWRFDFCWRAPYMVAVEIEGLVPQRIGKQLVVTGRHGTVKGIIEDMAKYNAAAQLGYAIQRFAAKQVKGTFAIENTMRMLSAKGWRP